jgi:hypothetical protein
MWVLIQVFFYFRFTNLTWSWIFLKLLPEYVMYYIFNQFMIRRQLLLNWDTSTQFFILLYFMTIVYWEKQIKNIFFKTRGSWLFKVDRKIYTWKWLFFFLNVFFKKNHTSSGPGITRALKCFSDIDFLVFNVQDFYKNVCSLLFLWLWIIKSNVKIFEN